MSIQAALVRSILEKWQAYTWTRQGFGFVRTKIADVGRIHVWDARLAVDGVSTAHTHPWLLESSIISGELVNQRFTVCPTGMPYTRSDIKTGEGGGLTGELQTLGLRSEPPEAYTSGASYQQKPEEIHRTLAQDGTVTLIQRPQGPPLEVAQVYWPVGTSWVSAEPRPIDGWELGRVIEYALARWFVP